MHQEIDVIHSSAMKMGYQMDKEELHRIIQHQEQQLCDLKKKIVARDRLIQQHKIELDDVVRSLASSNKAKAFLTTQLASQDRTLALIEQYKDPQILMREELQVAHEALDSLRKSFKSHDPHHHTIDTLEQSISLLMERLHFAELQKVVTEKYGKFSPDSINRRSKRGALLYSACQPPAFCNPRTGTHLTKVIYFIDGEGTPFMSSLSKRLGQITLRDFKRLFDKPGNCRYFFKSVDPEFGSVKEEVLHDEDLLPGWDGKVIAWVEHDED